MKTYLPLLAGIAVTAMTRPLARSADSTDARCDMYSSGADHASKTIPCLFAQRQGAVTITRDDGITHSLALTAETPGRFRDRNGRSVSRASGLGNRGQIFRFPDARVNVYWSTAARYPGAVGTDNPADPFQRRSSIVVDGAKIYEVPVTAIEGG